MGRGRDGNGKGGELYVSDVWVSMQKQKCSAVHRAYIML